MFKNNENSSESSKEDRVKFLDISNVSKSPLDDIKNIRYLEKSFGINHAVDFKNKGIIESDEELVKRRILEKFDLVNLGVEGFINKYFINKYLGF